MLSLESKPENIGEIEHFVNRLVDRYNIDRKLYPNLLISVTEAVNNAIYHGNHCDARKVVKINYKRIGNELHVFVSDEGNGFDPKCLPDPTSPANLRNCDGRGVFLMRELCHNIEYRDDGRTVKMKFKIQ